MPLRIVRVVVALILAATPVAAGTTDLRAVEEMMQSLAYESARNAVAIKDSYDDHLELLYLEEYESLAGALATGGLVPLPLHKRFNLAPRLAGPHPIGEKDLGNQRSYISARPFTIGCLLEIASRVKSGPIEITSLVRHGEYQNALVRTNGNARTEVPTHTMGLAFDIALINSPIETVVEIRDVLQQMRDAGDLLFIGERNQLVFHVVPHPSRLGHFMELYDRRINELAIESAQYVSLTEPAPVLTPPPAPPAPAKPGPAVELMLGLMLAGAAFPAGLMAIWKGCCTNVSHETRADADGVHARDLDRSHARPSGS